MDTMVIEPLLRDSSHRLVVGVDAEFVRRVSDKVRDGVIRSGGEWGDRRSREGDTRFNLGDSGDGGVGVKLNGLVSAGSRRVEGESLGELELDHLGVRAEGSMDGGRRSVGGESRFRCRDHGAQG